MPAGFISESWPASNRNDGRLQVGIPGRNKSESAVMASAIGAAASLPHAAGCAWRLTVSFATQACRMSLCPRHNNTRSKTCRQIQSSIFSAVAIAKPTYCPMSRGSFFRRSHLDGRAFRRSAISFTITFNLAMSMRAQQRRHGKSSMRVRAFVATTRIWPSPSAVA